MRLPASEAEPEGPNLTPVIDIVFNLLIFFLIATQFSQQEKDVSINLAEILRAQPLTMGVKELVVNIGRDGKYKLVGEELSESQLHEVLQQAKTQNPHQRVQIRADQEVQLKFPLTVVGFCKLEELDYSFSVLEQRAE